MEWLYYMVSMVYIAVLVITVGLLLIETYMSKTVSTEFKHRQYKHRVFSVKLLFVLVLCSVFEQTMMWLDKFGSERIDLNALFFETLTGQVWLALFVLVFIGLFIQKLSPAIIVLWALLLLLVESIDGHIASLASYTIIFDFIHLACAALWVGGIATFLLQWKEGKQELLSMMKSFMNMIWLTIVVMAISGALLTVLILPDPLYMIYSSWGLLIIMKLLLVCVALGFGYKVRQCVKKDKLPLAKALKIEALVLVFVLLLAGLITTINPEPKNNALNIHKMGDELHYTVELTPNRPGANTLNIILWTLEQEGDIAEVEVTLTDLEKGKRTAKVYRLTEVELHDPYDFMGFVESRFTYAEPLRLPYPSKWQQNITITFVSGEKRQFSMNFEN